jgi:outer membrane immunogenic protein
MANMKKVLLSGVALVALLAAAPANAADVPVRGPIYKAAPAPVFNWTGFYFGGHIGYGWSSTDIVVEPDGFLGGVQLGYNWQFSRNWVFGVETDIAGTDMNDSVGGVNAHVDYLGTARVRLGYTWDRTMIYGTGGLAYVRQSLLGVHDTDTGYAIGAGIEWAFAPAWSAKVEYMFHGFDNNIIGDSDISTIKFGVNYRFGSY